VTFHPRLSHPRPRGSRDTWRDGPHAGRPPNPYSQNTHAALCA
jgi:hypothetical protein